MFKGLKHFLGNSFCPVFLQEMSKIWAVKFLTSVKINQAPLPFDAAVKQMIQNKYQEYIIFGRKENFKSKYMNYFQSWKAL